LSHRHGAVPMERLGTRQNSMPPVGDVTRSFDERFAQIFNAQYPGILRYLDRLSGEPDLAADIAQEAFVRLYRRGSIPDSPGAWLVTVAMNLIRNVSSSRSRRRRLLTVARGTRAQADPPPAPDEVVAASETRDRVRQALQRLPERERAMLLLKSEGYSYRDIAISLGIQEASVGTLLARAKRAFREGYAEAIDAPQ